MDTTVFFFFYLHLLMFIIIIRNRLNFKCFYIRVITTSYNLV